MIEYFELGKRLDSSGRDSLYPQTISLLTACEQHPYITVRELRLSEQNNDRSEYLVIDVADGTVTSGNKAGIRRKERLAIEINPKFTIPILVHALRKDFPVLSHQHAGVPDSPKFFAFMMYLGAPSNATGHLKDLLSEYFGGSENQLNNVCIEKTNLLSNFFI
jgi:hypothetical protein